MAFLEDITRAIPAEDIDKTKEMVKKAHEAMDESLREGAIGPETATRVKVSLEETRAFLENFR